VFVDGQPDHFAIDGVPIRDPKGVAQSERPMLFEAWADGHPVHAAEIQPRRFRPSLQVRPEGRVPRDRLREMEVLLHTPCPMSDTMLELRAGALHQAVPAAPGVTRVALPETAGDKHEVLLSATLRQKEKVVSRRTAVVDLTRTCRDRDRDGVSDCDGDCDDRRAWVRPGVYDKIGDGIDADCDGINGRDIDRDGYEDEQVGGSDCDDYNAGVHPGAHEGADLDRDTTYAGDGLDNDCDGRIDERLGPRDCDDDDPHVHPLREEARVANGIDDDCDGELDEGTVFYDDDGDGLAEIDGDCDDADPTRSPRATEVLNCVDDDCDGQVDESGEQVARPSRVATLGQAWDEEVEGSRLVRVGRNRPAQVRFWTQLQFEPDWHIDVEVQEGATIGPLEVRLRQGDRELTRRTLSSVERRISYNGAHLKRGSDWLTLELHIQETPREWCPVRIAIHSP